MRRDAREGGSGARTVVIFLKLYCMVAMVAEFSALGAGPLRLSATSRGGAPGSDPRVGPRADKTPRPAAELGRIGFRDRAATNSGVRDASGVRRCTNFSHFHDCFTGDFQNHINRLVVLLCGRHAVPVAATTATLDTNSARLHLFALIASTGAPLNSPNTTLHACAVNTVALITTGHANTAPVSPMSVAPTPYV